MSNLPQFDSAIVMMRDDIVKKYKEVAREFSTLSKQVENMSSIDTKSLTKIVSELKDIIKKIDTLNSLISNAQQAFKKKLFGLVMDIKKTGKNTYNTNKNLINFINAINIRKGMFGVVTKRNVTKEYNPPRIIDMPSILQRMTKLRDVLQSGVQANKAQANQMAAKARENNTRAKKEEANRRLAENAIRARSEVVAAAGSLVAKASKKLINANIKITGGRGGVALGNNGNPLYETASSINSALGP